jgi:transcription initiation factor TFIIIB Brf1 subunit/transcription initiation factor TFIIB
MEERPMTQPGAYHKRLQRARQQRAHQAKQRRRERERERLQREQARAQQALRALEQAVQELGLPETVAEEVQWRLQAQQKLLGKIVGMLFPPCLWLPQLP